MNKSTIFIDHTTEVMLAKLPRVMEHRLNQDRMIIQWTDGSESQIIHQKERDIAVNRLRGMPEIPGYSETLLPFLDQAITKLFSSNEFTKHDPSFPQFNFVNSEWTPSGNSEEVSLRVRYLHLKNDVTATREAKDIISLPTDFSLWLNVNYEDDGSFAAGLTPTDGSLERDLNILIFSILERYLSWRENGIIKEEESEVREFTWPDAARDRAREALSVFEVAVEEAIRSGELTDFQKSSAIARIDAIKILLTDPEPDIKTLARIFKTIERMATSSKVLTVTLAAALLAIDQILESLGLPSIREMMKDE